MPLPVYVLNLARSVERRRFMSEELTRSGLSAVFVDAIDAVDLRRQAAVAPSGLTLAEWACLQTHREGWRRISASGSPAIVLEDDVQLLEGFVEIATAVAARARPDDLVLFGHHSSRQGPGEGAEVSWWRRGVGFGRTIGRPAEYPMGAYAMLIGPMAAAHLDRFAEPSRMPTDWVTGYSPRVGVRLLAITPPCAVPASIAKATTIEDRASEAHHQARARPTPPAALSNLWLFLRKLGIATAAYTFRLER